MRYLASILFFLIATASFAQDDYPTIHRRADGQGTINAKDTATGLIDLVYITTDGSDEITTFTMKLIGVVTSQAGADANFFIIAPTGQNAILNLEDQDGIGTIEMGSQGGGFQGQMHYSNKVEDRAHIFKVTNASLASGLLDLLIIGTGDNFGGHGVVSLVDPDRSGGITTHLAIGADPASEVTEAEDIYVWRTNEDATIALRAGTTDDRAVKFMTDAVVVASMTADSGDEFTIANEQAGNRIVFETNTLGTPKDMLAIDALSSFIDVLGDLRIRNTTTPSIGLYDNTTLGATIAVDGNDELQITNDRVDQQTVLQTTSTSAGTFKLTLGLSDNVMEWSSNDHAYTGAGAPTMVVRSEETNGAIGTIGSLRFWGRDSVNTDTLYLNFQVYVADETNGTEDSTVFIGGYDAGVSQTWFTWTNEAMYFRERTGNPAIVGNNAAIFSKDISAKAEMFVMDENGNVTQISSHRSTDGQGNTLPSFLPPAQGGSPSPHSIYSFNKFTGKHAVIDLTSLAKDLEAVTGKKYVYEWDETPDDWGADKVEIRRYMRESNADAIEKLTGTRPPQEEIDAFTVTEPTLPAYVTSRMPRTPRTPRTITSPGGSL